jgi:hypothetical protein
MRTRKSTLAILACVPLALAVACGGGGGSNGTSTTGNDQQGDNLPASTSSAITAVPLAGDMLADCTDQGVGLVDSVIDSVNAIGTLPVALPKLSDVVAMADLDKLPVLGGVVQDALGHLSSISATDVTNLIPGGVPGLANLPIPAQLPVVCSNLVAALPSNAVADPSQILALLGDPTHALGVIPVLDSSNNPVGVLLATVPAGLIPGSGTTPSLPGVTTLPSLTSLQGLDLSTLPVVGPTLATLTGNLLGSLNLGSLLSGGLLGILNGLIP